MQHVQHCFDDSIAPRCFVDAPADDRQLLCAARGRTILTTKMLDPSESSNPLE
jgi:hypothetical protein